MALTDKQTLFANEYLQDFNRTQAAIRAGYSEKTAYAQGARLLKNAEIAEVITQRLQESAMSADEVLMRLAEHARGDIDNYLSEDGCFDLKKARRARRTGLIKKLKTKTTTRLVGDEDIKTTEVEFELYDAQAALALIGKYHKLFIDRTELSGTGGGPVQVETSAKPDLTKLSIDELLQLRQIVNKASDGVTNS